MRNLQGHVSLCLQSGRTLIFGKGTLVSVSPSKYLIAIEYDACPYRITYNR